ncbi:MAG: hypothetical protein JW860_02590, partial [Sedimentisphaerales bacterium]|nr:hypothetical protein [Sedimentisphaerales bacterium]
MESYNSEQSVHTWRDRSRSYTQKNKLYQPCFMGCVLLCILVWLLPAPAGPSGGPYGPIQQTYDLPEDAGKIYYVAPDGKAENSGETLGQPTTIEVAIERVVTGDAIVMRGGIYRTGDLIFNQGITIQPYQDEQPVLKGTRVASQWQLQPNGLWTISWDRLFPQKPDDWWRRGSHGSST